MALPPTFLVVGAPRAATTSLHYYLRQHPDVTMSTIKEPNFFLFDQEGDGSPFVPADPRITGKAVSKPAAYEKLFTEHTTAVGEASPLYLYTEQTPGLVSRMLPDVRIIAIVRPPAERSLSHFMYTYDGPAADADAAFEAAVARELPLADAPFVSGQHNLRLSRYAAQLRRWSDVLDRSRIQVLDYRQLTGAPATTMRAVSTFIGVDPEFAYDVDTKYNPSTSSDATTLKGRVDKLIKPAFPYIKKALPASVSGKLAHRRAQARAAARGDAMAIPPSVAGRLQDYFAEDVAYVRDEWGIDLSS